MQIERFFESNQLVLDTFLLAFHRIGCRAVGLQRLVHQILRLEDIALEHPATEIVVERESHGVVDVGRHDIGGIDIGTQIFIRNPEHRHGVLSHIVHDCQNRTDRQCLDIEYGVVLVEIPRFLYVIGADIAGRNIAFVDYESDIPSETVRSYYIKEAWYFDQNNSVFDVKTLAICPIMTTSGDVGELTMPMFWIPYESIRPYINTAFIMTSNINNAMTFTLDDYFRRRMFEGEIYKTQNLMNQPLMAYCPTPDSIKKEQDRIEGQLVAFEKSLWFQPDTTQVEDPKAAKKAKKASARGQGGATTEKAVKETKEKTVKTKAPKAEKSSPVRSVRRRR